VIGVDKSRLHSLTKGSCPRYAIDPETGFEEVAVLVMGSRLADTNFYASSSRGRIRLQPDVIVDRIAKTLLAAQVSLRRLN
jgi:hypothetical protein